MGFLCTSAKINLCQILLQMFSGQLIVCILIKHELRNQEICIFQTRGAESGNLYIPKSLHSSAQEKVYLKQRC